VVARLLLVGVGLLLSRSSTVLPFTVQKAKLTDVHGKDISAEVTVGDRVLQINHTPVGQISSISSALTGLEGTPVVLQFEEQESKRKYSITCIRNLPTPTRKVYTLRKEIVLPDLYVDQSVIRFPAVQGFRNQQDGVKSGPPIGCAAAGASSWKTL